MIEIKTIKCSSPGCTATMQLQVEETGPRPGMSYPPGWRCHRWTPGVLCPPGQPQWKDEAHLEFYCPTHRDMEPMK